MKLLGELLKGIGPRGHKPAPWWEWWLIIGLGGAFGVGLLWVFGLFFYFGAMTIIGWAWGLI